jgi:competence protein ComEC
VQNAGRVWNFRSLSLVGREFWISDIGVVTAVIDYFGRITDRIRPVGTASQTGARPGFAAIIGKLVQWLSANLGAEQERWFPWVVVGFGAGIALYFSLPTEPSFAMAVGVVGAALGCVALKREVSSTAGGFLLLFAASALFGFADSQLRTRIVAAPVISREIGPVRLAGRVEDVEIRAPDRARIIIAVIQIDGQENHPAFVRLTISGERALRNAQPGTVLSALTMLHPPPEPAIPHGYDFARWAWFQEIGGVGFVYGTPRVLKAAVPGFVERLNSRLDDLRLAMTNRIERAIPGPDGSIAASLITGERGEIDPDDNQAYRDSGLAHVLSISGVHLALAGLGVFWALRALLALWQRIALTQPIKKWAALGALLGSTFYLAISGGGAPANRSWMMLTMMLLGVMLDRPALSMRSVAMAALAILIFQPENMIDPSFQMSFAAVIGLIALAESQSGRHSQLPRPAGGLARLWKKGRHYILGALSVSIVATLATTPIAIYHFDRAAAYSLLANLLAEPVVAFVVMPAAAVAVVVMPVGLESVPLHVMGWGVHAMSAIAHWVAGLPGATAMVRTWPVVALAIMGFGGLWIALWGRSWRWLGLAPIAASLLLILASRPPDLLIARDLRSAAIRGPDGKLVIVGERPDSYTAEQWLIRDGDRRDISTARTSAHCDDVGCVAYGKNSRTLAIANSVSSLPDDCARAQIVISTLPLHGRCQGPELLVDASDISHNGAMAVRFSATHHDIMETAAASRGNRPWSAHQ